MQYFIGIVPPEEYKQQITSFRNRWDSNRLREIVEPHITVKAQGGLTEDMIWLERVREVLSATQSFQLSFTEPAMFGTAVIFLDVKSEGIHELHKLLVDTVSPSTELIKRYFELDSFHPHLTLGQTYWGMKESEIEEMKFTSRNALAPFPSYNVTYVRVYREIEPNKYVPFEDIQLVI